MMNLYGHLYRKEEDSHLLNPIQTELPGEYSLCEKPTIDCTRDPPFIPVLKT